MRPREGFWQRGRRKHTAGDDKGKVRGRRRGRNEKQKRRTKKSPLVCTDHCNVYKTSAVNNNNKKRSKASSFQCCCQPVATSPASSSNKRIAGRFVSVFGAVPAGEACRVRPDDGPLAPHAAAVQATSTKLYSVYGCRPAVREGGEKEKAGN